MRAHFGVLLAVGATCWSYSAVAEFGRLDISPEVVDGLKAAREMATYGDDLWPGFSSTPFGFLYVTDIGEVLLCDDRLPENFQAGARSEPLDCTTALGPSSWRQTGMLASMPAFGAPEVIVMGAPEKSGLDGDAWIRTVIHEHFHQWQGALPSFYVRIEELGLSGGDESGMWMLNYPFPYEDPEVSVAYALAAQALNAALDSDDEALRERLGDYLAARRLFQRSVSPADWRYFDFQIWKEGVARWTDIAIARKAERGAKAEAEKAWEQELHLLHTATLKARGRAIVYSFGAAEAALLERIDPDWRGCYRVTLGLTECWESLLLPSE